MTDKRVLVTGAAGTLGAIVGEDLSRDHDLVALDREMPYDAQGPVQWVEADLCDPAESQLRGELERCTAVVHAAGERRPSARWATLRPGNIDATAALLRLAAKSSTIRQVVLFSSLHAVGTSAHGGGPWTRGPQRPPHVIAPASLYGASKAAMEALGAAHADHGMRVTVMRIGAAEASAAVREPTAHMDYPVSDRTLIADVRWCLDPTRDGSDFEIFHCFDG